jgi:FMN phosphatase YigB (HAD superfamily)
MTFSCKRSTANVQLSILSVDRGCGYRIEGPFSSRVRATATQPLCCSSLLFDAGDVLYDETAWWRWVVRLLSHLGRPIQYADLDLVWRREHASDIQCGARDYWEAFRAFLRSAGLAPAQIEEVVLASQPQRRQFVDTIRLLPGVRSTVARLAASGVPMGVLSNGPDSEALVTDRLHRLGIGLHFQAVLASVDLGLSGSDRRIYVAAAEAMGTVVSELAFVGHDADELSGAASAGARTIACNCDPDARADVYLDRFNQLTQTVQIPPSPRRQAG